MRVVRRIRRRTMTWLRALRRLVGLSPSDMWRLLRAQAMLVKARLLLSTRRKGELVETESVTPSWASGDLERARAWALMVKRAAAFGLFRPTCLVRSLALTSLLEGDGIHGARIRIGVRQEKGTVQAHAWVEYGGEVIGDFEEHVATFHELTDVRLIRQGRS